MSTESEDLRDLLKHFDAELSGKLAHLVGTGALSASHVKELLRLTAARPDFRDPEALDSLLEDAEEMDADAFRVWIDNTIETDRDT